MQSVAKRAFAELVERASACDRIRGVLALIKRHENLFRLPMRIRQATERGLYDQVHALLSSALRRLINDPSEHGTPVWCQLHSFSASKLLLVQEAQPEGVAWRDR